MSTAQPTPPPVPPVPNPDDELRKAAKARIDAKRNFWRYVATWVILSVFFTLIWLFSGRGHFWPGWIMVAMAIGGAFMGYNAYGPGGPPSEERINREMDKMR